MFRVTSNAFASTGDGPAVLARRGVLLEDMEFFQFGAGGRLALGRLSVGSGGPGKPHGRPPVRIGEARLFPWEDRHS
ncbi:MAG: hypothetical protein ACXW2V_06940 [Candidatus Aminicenantales bacterium]